MNTNGLCILEVSLMQCIVCSYLYVDNAPPLGVSPGQMYHFINYRETWRRHVMYNKHLMSKDWISDV